MCCGIRNIWPQKGWCKHQLVLSNAFQLDNTISIFFVQLGIQLFFLQSLWTDVRFDDDFSCVVTPMMGYRISSVWTNMNSVRPPCWFKFIGHCSALGGFATQNPNILRINWFTIRIHYTHHHVVKKWIAQNQSIVFRDFVQIARCSGLSN